MNFKTWWQCYNHNKVILRTLTDSKIDGFVYELTETLIDKSELPPEARHCRGEHYYYSLDLTTAHYEFEKYPNNACANDLYRHLHTNVFDKLLSMLWKEGDHINIKKLLIIGGIIVAVVIGFYVFKGGF